MSLQLERRNYKIYINDRPLYLIDRRDAEEVGKLLPEDTLTVSYRGQKKALINCIDTLEKSGRSSIVVMASGGVKKLYKEFKSLFMVIPACGGLVMTTDHKQTLMIKRRGHWDLPKGKKEGNEKKKQTARREVEEETGVEVTAVGDKLITTRHTFRKKDGKRALKVNHWFVMTAKTSDKLVPQAEEDITRVEWVKRSATLKKEPMFESIKDVLLAFE